MKFEPNKAFPHPVLRPTEGGADSGDFPDFGFQTSFDVAIDDSAGAIRIETEFQVQQSDILREITLGKAAYSLLLVCPNTYYRAHVASRESAMVASIALGDVDHQVEVRPSIVAMQEIGTYRPSDLHAELIGQAYAINVGGLLAQDYSSTFPASREFLRPITSIFQIAPDPKQPSGQLDIVVGDPVQLIINNKDNQRLLAARRTNKGRESLMNSVYLPAVVNLLAEAVRLREDESGSRWFSVVHYQLEEVGVGLEKLVDGRVTLWHAAQALLKFPANYAQFMTPEKIQ